jgi:hypothetical protein
MTEHSYKPDLSNVRLVEPPPPPPAAKPATLKEQLEAEIASAEAEARHWQPGWDWHHLSDEEEAVFEIDRDRFPRMVTAFSCYEGFKLITMGDVWDTDLIEQARQAYPQWCDEQIYTVREFQDFAKEFAGLSAREAHAMFRKQEFWNIRAGHASFADEQKKAISTSDLIEYE